MKGTQRCIYQDFTLVTEKHPVGMVWEDGTEKDNDEGDGGYLVPYLGQRAMLGSLEIVQGHDCPYRMEADLMQSPAS